MPETDYDPDGFVTKMAIRDYLDENNISADFFDALGEEVQEILDDAARRAESNERKTVQPRDL